MTDATPTRRELDDFEDWHLRCYLDRILIDGHAETFLAVADYVRENPDALDHPDHELRLGWAEIIDRAALA